MLCHPVCQPSTPTDPQSRLYPWRRACAASKQVLTVLHLLPIWSASLEGPLGPQIVNDEGMAMETAPQFFFRGTHTF